MRKGKKTALYLQYNNNNHTFTDLEAWLADVNGDGSVNASDLLLIQQIQSGQY